MDPSSRPRQAESDDGNVPSSDSDDLWSLFRSPRSRRGSSAGSPERKGNFGANGDSPGGNKSEDEEEHDEVESQDTSEGGDGDAGEGNLNGSDSWEGNDDDEGLLRGGGGDGGNIDEGEEADDEAEDVDDEDDWDLPPIPPPEAILGEGPEDEEVNLGDDLDEQQVNNAVNVGDGEPNVGLLAGAEQQPPVYPVHHENAWYDYCLGPPETFELRVEAFLDRFEIFFDTHGYPREMMEMVSGRSILLNFMPHIEVPLFARRVFEVAYQRMLAFEAEERRLNELHIDPGVEGENVGAVEGAEGAAGGGLLQVQEQQQAPPAQEAAEVSEGNESQAETVSTQGEHPER